MPGDEIDGEIIEEIKKNDIKHIDDKIKKETHKKALKSFDLKRAVVYSEIINKKYS